MDLHVRLLVVWWEALLFDEVDDRHEYGHADGQERRDQDQIAHLRNEAALLPHESREDQGDHVVHDTGGDELRDQQLQHERQLVAGLGFVLFEGSDVGYDAF